MFTFLVVLILLTACLLILAVLVQNTKQDGLGNTYFGEAGGVNQLMGVQKTSDLLEQITWGLVAALFVLTLTTSMFLDKGDRSDALNTSPNIAFAQKQGALLDKHTDEDAADTLSYPTDAPESQNDVG